MVRNLRNTLATRLMVALGEAVDLLLGLAAALGQQDLGVLDDGGIQGPYVRNA